MVRHFAIWAAVSVAGVACVGNIGGEDGADGGSGASGAAGPNPLTFECKANADPSATDIRRLTRRQYENTLRELLSPLDAGTIDSIVAGLAVSMTLVPVDATDKDHDYLQMDETVSQAHVDGYYAVGRAFGTQVSSSPARTSAFVGACATDADTSNDAKCIEDFIRKFGLRAMRRPLTEDEVTFFRDEIYAVNGPIDPRGIVDVVTALLMSPQFAFQIENGNAPRQGRTDLYALTGYEIASRLSFHFWQSMPDDALFEAAANGELETEAGYEAAVERVFLDARTVAAIDDFYGQWLRTDRVPNMLDAVDKPDFQAFAGEDLPGPDFRENVLEDTRDLLRYFTWDETQGSFDDLFLTDLSFAKTDDVARLYGGVPLWTEGTPPMSLPAGQRAGLLTRPAMVMNNKKTTRPILKGAFIRKRLICDVIELPTDMKAMMSNLDIDSDLSTRQRVEALTEQPGSDCSGCHSQLNPLGYATENFDALGRARTEEILYDTEGNVIARVPVDTHVTPNVSAGDTGTIDDGVALSEMIIESTKAHACFARHYFRFTYGREEDFEQDGCVLERLRVGIVEGGSLHDMLKDVAMQPEFRLRKQGGAQ